MPDNKEEESAPPPTPPPPPPVTPGSNVSPFVLKLRSAPPGYFFQPETPPALTDLFATPTGPYFFYGMLSDPTMLCDVLGLENEPQLRPATITGYECKLWGQYAALLHGPTGSVVHGAVYYVPTVEQGERLARYETNSYRVEPRCIRYTDGDRSMEELGYTFKFVGNGNDLTEGGV